MPTSGGRHSADPAAAACPAGEWQHDNPDVRLAGFTDAARNAELVVLAVGGGAALDVLGRVGEEHLAGKVLLDVANPLGFSTGFPPTLTVKDTDSLAEQVQRAFPAARVVTSLNTMTAAVMVDPAQLPQGSTVFVSGDDADAKTIVTALVGSFGHDDVIDLGDLSSARGAEMFLPLWVRLMGALGTSTFNIKVVRPS